MVSLLSTIVVFLVFLNSRNEFISDINSSFDITDDNLEYVDIGDPKQFMTERFEGAVKMMADSDYGSAERTFGQISSSPITKQPTVNWALFNQGLSILLQGDLERARTVYQRLEEKSDYSEEPDDQRLCRFFKQSSQLLSQRKPISYDQLVNFEGKGFESMALLAFGLQNWEHDDFDDAEEYLNLFTLDELPDNYPWIKWLKDIPSQYLSDIDLFRRFPSLRENPNSNDVLTALSLSDEILPLVNFKKIKKILDDRVVGFQRLSEELVVKETQEEKSRMASLRISELQKMLELMNDIKDYSKDFHFNNGVELIKPIVFNHPEFIQRRSDLLEIWRSSESFIQNIINDINKEPYYGNILTKDGSLRSLKIISADREFFTHSFGAAQGTANLPLGKISASSLVRISIFYDKFTTDKDLLIERYIERTLFCYVTGNLSQSAKYSSQVNDDSFKELWARILEFERSK